MPTPHAPGVQHHITNVHLSGGTCAHCRRACDMPQEYITFDMNTAMIDAGFQPPLQRDSTPRHKTVVAVKPAKAA